MNGEMIYGGSKLGQDCLIAGQANISEVKAAVGNLDTQVDRIHSRISELEGIFSDVLAPAAAPEKNVQTEKVKKDSLLAEALESKCDGLINAVDRIDALIRRVRL